MTDTSDEAVWPQHVIWPFTACAIIVSVAGQWQPRYADPQQLLGAGTLFAGFLLAPLAASTFKSKHIRWLGMLLGAASFLCGGWILGEAVNDSGKSSMANDARCLAIQRDMLGPSPKRSDGPGLFQAFGCRPQGEGTVYAPARKIRTGKAERRK